MFAKHGREYEKEEMIGEGGGGGSTNSNIVQL